MKSWSFYKTSLYECIYKKIRKYPKMDYLQRVWRHRNDRYFVDQVMKILHDPEIFQLKIFGNKNPEKNLYLISLEANSGLGAALRVTLLGLSVADQLHFVPVVVYQPETCTYAESRPIHGTTNPFEYFFVQPGDITLEETYESRNVFLYNQAHHIRAEHDIRAMMNLSQEYVVNDVYLEKLAYLFKKYMRLNSFVQTAVERDMHKLCPKWQAAKILGVHIRGTDYALNWVNHPHMVSADDFMMAIDETLEKYNIDYVFLATDDMRRLDALQKRYGSKLLYYKDVHRATGNIGVHEEKNSRPMNRYLNGLEVIRDMYTLAKCSGLICGLSQVSFMARIIRLSQESPYDFVKILDNGIYRG